MKQKTINYLHSSVNKLEVLFGKAVEYRSKFDKATTAVAKAIYKKKLKKIIKQMEPYMGLFNDIQALKDKKHQEELITAIESEIEADE